MFAHHQGLAVVGVQHAAVLDIAAFANFNGLGIAANHAAKPHAGVGVQGDSTHHLRAVGYPGRGGHLGLFAIEFVNRHEMLL